MTGVAIFGTALLLCFLACALGSALLQLLAWTRHAREGVPVSLRALWKPEGYFDPVGLNQMRLARRLMLVGIVAYLSYGVVLLMVQTFGGR